MFIYTIINNDVFQKSKAMNNHNENFNVGCPRVGESNQQIKIREKRLYSIGSDWYFRTREGIDEGPFDSKKNAEDAINLFIRKIAFNLIRDDVKLG